MSSETVKTVQRVFLMSHRRRATSMVRAELIAAIREVLGALGREGDRLSYVYSFVVKEGPLASSGTGGVSGIRMPGDQAHYYSLDAGVGMCDLGKLGIDETGRGYLVETTDCRDKKSLATANAGEIKFNRRRIELTLPTLMKDLESKLIGQDCAEVTLSYRETLRRP